MSSIQDFHRQAMDLAEIAFTAKRKGDSQQASELFRQAFEYERKTAELVANDIDAEPTPLGFAWERCFSRDC